MSSLCSFQLEAFVLMNYFFSCHAGRRVLYLVCNSQCHLYSSNIVVYLLKAKLGGGGGGVATYTPANVVHVYMCMHCLMHNS